MVGIGEIIGKLNDGTEQGPDSDTNIDHHLIYDKCGGEKVFFINWYWVNWIFMLTPTLQHKN